MTLDVNKDAMTIMGVQFQNKKVFRAVWNAISTSMIENFVPTVTDVEKLKLFAESKVGVTQRG